MPGHRTPQMERVPLTSSELEHVLRIVKQRDAAIWEELDSLRASVGRVESLRASDLADLKKGFESVRDGVDELTRVVLRHVQAGSEADRERDAITQEHSVALARSASSAGGASGAKWGGVVSAATVGISYAVWELVKGILK